MALIAAASRAAVVPSDPIDSGDVRVLLLATQAAAAMHFGQAQGDGQSRNQTPDSDTWGFPESGLWEWTTIAGGNSFGNAITLTTNGDHDPVTGSERRTEFSLRNSGSGYDYDLTLGNTYWFWLRYWMVDRTAYPSVGNFVHISPWQLHSKVGGNPPSANYLLHQTASITGLKDGGSAFTTVTGINQPMGQWVTDIVKIKMNPGTSDGILQVWRDGVSIVDKTGIDFGYAGNDGYIKFGQYVYPGGNGASIHADLTKTVPIYHDTLQLHVAGAGLVDDDSYSYQDIEDHAAHQLDIELAPAITFPHVERTRAITPPSFSTEQQITFPHIERTRAITPPLFSTGQQITFPHITRGGYGNYQAGYGDGRIGIMTFSTLQVASMLFIPPDSATQKSPTLTADFARNHPTSIFH
ncbi:MAG: hypothetical protein GY701_07045, partial [Sulfitobacter sp.]|nr:hypothetical protein [Sulfitobacter sp.]